MELEKINYQAAVWRGGRVAEGNGLLNRRTGLSWYRGFESRPLRFAVNKRHRLPNDAKPSSYKFLETVVTGHPFSIASPIYANLCQEATIREPENYKSQLQGKFFSDHYLSLEATDLTEPTRA